MGLPNSSSDGGANGGGNDAAVRLTMASDFTAVRVVQDQIMAQVAQCRFDAQAQFAIKLALEEGLINAIKHGNKLDPAKTVDVQYSCSPAVLDVTIHDQGVGFDRADVPDPTLEENIEKCSGRGILLIEAYMDSVAWTDHGRRMHMVKRNANRA